MEKKILIFPTLHGRVLLGQRIEDYGLKGFWSPYGGRKSSIFPQVFCVNWYVGQQTGRFKKFRWDYFEKSISRKLGVTLDGRLIKDLGTKVFGKDEKVQLHAFTAEISSGLPVPTDFMRKHEFFMISEIKEDRSFKIKDEYRYFLNLLN